MVRGLFDVDVTAFVTTYKGRVLGYHDWTGEEGEALQARVCVCVCVCVFNHGQIPAQGGDFAAPTWMGQGRFTCCFVRPVAPAQRVRGPCATEQQVDMMRELAAWLQNQGWKALDVEYGTHYKNCINVSSAGAMQPSALLGYTTGD